MKIIENELAKEIIEDLIPKSILELNPIISGGFMVMIYDLIINNKNDLTYKVQYAKKNSKPDGSWACYLLNNMNPEFIKKHDDIDFWFQKDNPIWKSDNPLVAEKPKIKPIPKSIFAKKSTSFFSLPQVAAPNQEYEDIILLDCNLHMLQHSSWANTFSCLRSKFTACKLQFIKKQYEDIEDLFSNFDIYNCCIAYFDGKFYIHDEAEKGFKEGILLSNLNVNNESFIKRLYISNRSFKYSNRYCLQPSETLMNTIFDVYQDCITLQQALKNGKGLEDIDLGALEGIKDPYGRNGSVPKEKIKGMMDQLFCQFNKFVLLDNYKEIWTMYMVNCEDPTVKSVVSKMIENKSEEYRKVHSSIKLTEAKPKVKVADSFDNFLDDIFGDLG